MNDNRSEVAMFSLMEIERTVAKEVERMIKTFEYFFTENIERKG